MRAEVIDQFGERLFHQFQTAFACGTRAVIHTCRQIHHQGDVVVIRHNDTVGAFDITDDDVVATPGVEGVIFGGTNNQLVNRRRIHVHAELGIVGVAVGIDNLDAKVQMGVSRQQCGFDIHRGQTNLITIGAVKATLVLDGDAIETIDIQIIGTDQNRR